MQQVKFVIIVFLVFVLLTLTGGILHESIRALTAKILSYQINHFFYGQLFFISGSMQTEFEKEMKKNPVSYRNSSEWKILVKQNTREHALIGLSGRIFIWTTGLSGLALLFFRREKRKNKFGFIDWTGVFMTLFFLKDVLMTLFFLLAGRMPCDYAKCALYFGLPVFTTEYVIGGLGAVITAYTVFRIVPGNKSIAFFVSGLAGGITGLYLWGMYVAEMIFF